MPPERPSLFIVDDNEGLRASLADLFDDAGIEVVGEAGDAAEALRKVPPAAYLHVPLVVLMDMRMPGRVNGIEATRLLLDRCDGLRVLMFTAFGGPAIESAARAAGAVDVLTKGIPAAEIVAAVQRAWSGVPVTR